jgi:hypothetical protein
MMDIVPSFTGRIQIGNAFWRPLFTSLHEPWLYGRRSRATGRRFAVPFWNEPAYIDFTPRPAERSGAVISGAPQVPRPPRTGTAMSDILMPKATAVWLVDNTSLTFEQIADFCGLHPLEVRGIADGDVARDIRGADPLVNGQLTREELDKAQADETYRMKAVVSRHAELLKSTKPAPKYTPVSRRQDRPDAIMWFVKNHPEVTDAQIAKMLGTTKATIESVRNRTHWNSANIKPVDPVTLGLVGQLALDDLVKKAAEKKARDDAKSGGATLKSAAEVEEAPAEPEFVPEAAERRGAEPTAESVFGSRD